MAQAQSDQVVNSYLEGLKLQLARQSQAQENALRQAESERAQKQTEMMQKQFDQSVSQADLARKSAEANFRFNIQSHANDLAQNQEPDKDPKTGQPIVDEKGIGTYTVQGPTGVPIQLKAPTRETQISLAQQAAQKQADIRQQETAKQLEQEHQNRIGELGMTQANAQSLEQQRMKNEQDLASKRELGENTRAALERQTQVQLSRINNGLDDGFGNTNPAVATTKDRVLSGDLTDADLTGLKYAPAVRGQVLQSGGIVPKQKDIDKIKALAGLGAILPKVFQAIQSQPDISGKGTGDTIQAGIRGTLQKFTDPDAREKFGELSGYAPTISQVVGGEAGQRLTDFKIAMSDAGFLPSITNPKGENIRRVNNLVDKLHSASDEILSSYPVAQRALILKKYGVSDIQPMNFMQKQQQMSQPVSPEGTQANPQVDPNSFFLGGK